MSLVIVEKTPKMVCRVTINRPEARNALNTAVMNELSAVFEDVAQDDDVRAVILTGVGDKAFCAGGDIRAGARAKGDVEDSPFAIQPGKEHPLARLLHAADNIPVPFIARVNGHALGGGFGLVCMADMAVASRNIKLGTPEAKIGLFPMIILVHMLRLIPLRQLYEMTFSGRLWNADEARVNGVVNQVVETVEDLDDAVDALLEPILENAPTAIRVGKKALKALEYMDFEQRLEYAQIVISQLSLTEDAREGMSAFVEKRKPVWAGR